jgi:hypothetical protein
MVRELTQRADRALSFSENRDWENDDDKDDRRVIVGKTMRIECPCEVI